MSKRIPCTFASFTSFLRLVVIAVFLLPTEGRAKLPWKLANPTEKTYIKIGFSQKKCTLFSSFLVRTECASKIPSIDRKGFAEAFTDFRLSHENKILAAGIGGFVWADSNENGIQDPDEIGIEGVTIHLFNGSDVEQASTISDSLGNYFFSNLPAGNYYLFFDPSTNATGILNILASPQNQGIGTNDSDPDPLSGRTTTFSFDPLNGDLNDIDAGFFFPTSIVGDFVFKDCNNDGIQDAGEMGIADVPVALSGTNIQGLPINLTTLTDPDGFYQFDKVQPGNYALQFSFPTTHTGLAWSPQNQGNDAFDSDVDSSGLTASISINGGENRDDIDAGLRDVEAPVFVNPPPDTTISCDDPLVGNPPDVTATDNWDSQVNIIFSEQTVPGNGACNGWTITRTWTASDACGNDAAYTQLITVGDETPPVILGVPADITVDCDSVPPPATPSVSDNCQDNVPLQFTEATVGDTCGTLQIFRAWFATDNCGNATTEQQKITVIFGAFQLVNVPPDITISCADSPPPVVDPQVNTTCLGVEINFNEMLVPNGCGQQLIRTWTATSICGDEATASQVISLVDQQPPVILDVPSDLTVDFTLGETVPDPPSLTATDGCDSTVTVELMETTSANPQGCGFTLTRTWVATDDCGNQTFDSQIITVLDVCDCPDIIVNNVVIQASNCGQNNGSISVDVNAAPGSYQYLLIPFFGTPNDTGNVITNLPPGFYLLIIDLPGLPDCNEKIFFNIFQQNCIDTVDVTIPQQPTDICLDETVFDFPGMITSGAFCDAGDPAMVLGSNINGPCLTLTPALGFVGTSDRLICTIHCFDGSSVNCDTTYIRVTVDPGYQPCSQLSVEFTGTDPSCDGAGGVISISASGNEGNLTYIWDPPVSTSNQGVDLPEGIYNITVTDEATACFRDTFIVLTAPELVELNQLDVAVSAVNCPGGTDGHIISTTGTEYDISNAEGIPIGQTPFHGLPAGIYTISNSNGQCTASIQVQIAEPPPWEFAIATTPETCAGNDGTISLSVTGGSAPYFFNWTPSISTDSLAIGLNTNDVFSVIIEDQNGCTKVLEDLVVGYDCDSIPCILSILISNQNASNCGQNNGSVSLVVTGATGMVTYNWNPPVSTNQVAEGLAPGTYGVTATDEKNCQDSLEVLIEEGFPVWEVAVGKTPESCDGNDGSILLNVTGGGSGFVYDWFPPVSNTNIVTGLSATDNLSVTVTDSLGCSRSLTGLSVSNDCPSSCGNLFASDFEYFATSNCDGFAEVCLDVPLSEMLNYSFTDNGLLYIQGVEGCLNDTSQSYSYLTLPGQGFGGPYELISWKVNGTSFFGTFEDVSVLVDSMNVWDTTGDWVLNTVDFLIEGGNPQSDYSILDILHMPTNGLITLGLNTNLIPKGSKIFLPLGEHELVFTKGGTTCMDTLTVDVVCIESQIFRDTIDLGNTDSLCLDISQLPGDLFTEDIFCNDCQNVSFSLNNDCLFYTGILGGTDTATVVFCDDFGLCDTLVAIIYVNDQILPPVARNDFDSIEMNMALNLDLLANDSINGELKDFKIILEPDHGISTIELDNTVTYTSVGQFCGLEKFNYRICNKNGCDSASVTVKVLCQQPYIVNGFSPNGDGINETFFISGLEQFPDNELSIFNRWGSRVFKQKNYHNKWQGKYRGEDLPDGTYFYYFTYGDGKRVAGFVQLQR